MLWLQITMAAISDIKNGLCEWVQKYEQWVKSFSECLCSQFINSIDIITSTDVNACLCAPWQHMASFISQMEFRTVVLYGAHGHSIWNNFAMCYKVVHNQYNSHGVTSTTTYSIWHTLNNSQHTLI
jgi:hypothetical protein